MPDITMCPSETCLVRDLCYRNPASGTKPNEWRQAWFYYEDGPFKIGPGKDATCDYYWMRK